MIFVLLMFFTEWLITAVVYGVILRLFKIDAMKVGGRGLVTTRGRRIATVFAVHILMDSFVSLNNLTNLRF